jgi:hypothetical protein
MAALRVSLHPQRAVKCLFGTIVPIEREMDGPSKNKLASVY